MQAQAENKGVLQAEADSLLSPDRNLVPDFDRVLLACMPKSGSTYLAKIFGALPGCRRARLVSVFERREQEIDFHIFAAQEELTRKKMAQSAERANRNPRGYIAQHHVTFNANTAMFIRDYRLIPVVLVRNIYDVVISLRDHVRDNSVNMAMSYVDDRIKALPDEELHSFLVDMAMPWYIKFFVSWAKSGVSPLFITYEDLRADEVLLMQRLLSKTSLSFGAGRIEKAIAAANEKYTRKNVGKTGRGQVLSEDERRKIEKYASYYPDIDFSLIGIERSNA